jgi:hypothetical protein
MGADHDTDGCCRSAVRLADRGAPTPIDTASGQMKEKVDYAGLSGPATYQAGQTL